jgi:hypothetical protein
MQLSRKCSGCGETFRKTEMVEYFSPTGKTSHWYCPKCLEEKQARERFANKVCQLFGIKAPGPVIWTQRKRLQNEYGYTDDAIIDCLDYIYNVKKMKKLSETLGLVNPRNMEETRAWKEKKKAEGASLAAAVANTQMKEYIVPVRENKSKKKETSLDDGLFDD